MRKTMVDLTIFCNILYLNFFKHFSKESFFLHSGESATYLLIVTKQIVHFVGFLLAIAFQD